MISIITSVYKREKYLTRLFNSLVNQPVHFFEWIVLDDGSPNSLELLVDGFRKLADFDIEYIRLKHGGKHRALNVGISRSKYEAFIIIDSDDVLLNDSVCKMNEWWNTIKDDDSFVGAAGILINQNGVKSCENLLFSEKIDILWSEKNMYGINGESGYIFRRKYWLLNPLPEFDGEDFCSEVISMYSFCDKGWKIRWFNDVAYMYEYLPDGLTSNISIKNQNNPKGYAAKIHSMKNSIKDKNVYLNACRAYYEKCFNVINDIQIACILDISEEERKVIEKSILLAKTKLEKALMPCKKWSLYGFGTWGHIMESYLGFCNIEIDSVFDKGIKSDLNTRIKNPMNGTSGVENVIICIKQTDTCLREYISDIFSDANVVYMNDIHDNWDEWRK